MAPTTIKNRRDFLAAANGAKCVASLLVMQALKRPDQHPAGPEPRIGYTVTKKMGNAPVRNRIKRRLREAAKRQAHLMVSGHDYVIIARTRLATCDFDALLRELAFAFSRVSSNKNA